MNSLLKKALAFKDNYPRCCFLLSLAGVIGSSAASLTLLKSYQRKEALVNAYKTLYKSSVSLQNAQALLKHTQTDVPQFVTSKIEPVKLLKNLELRYEQSLNPSYPVDLNPYENCLRHTVRPYTSLGLARWQIELDKPVYADEEDLKELFALIENRAIFPYEKSNDTPFVFFSYFSLEKHFLPSCEKVYQISYRLESVKL